MARFIPFIILCCSLLINTAFAESSENNEETVMVELIVFEPINQETIGQTIKTPFFAGLDKAILAEPNLTLKNFSLLSPNQFELKQSHRALSINHQILLHLAWIQPLHQNQPVFIDSGLFNAKTPLTDNIKGLVKVDKKAFFQLSTNLILDKACKANESESQRCLYPMNEVRNLKEAQVHYLDNPSFGMIVKITSKKG